MAASRPVAAILVHAARPAGQRRQGTMRNDDDEPAARQQPQRGHRER